MLNNKAMHISTLPEKIHKLRIDAQIGLRTGYQGIQKYRKDFNENPSGKYDLMRKSRYSQKSSSNKLFSPNLEFQKSK
jgi:hypothetical protein